MSKYACGVRDDVLYMASQRVMAPEVLPDMSYQQQLTHTHTTPMSPGRKTAWKLCFPVLPNQ